MGRSVIPAVRELEHMYDHVSNFMRTVFNDIISKNSYIFSKPNYSAPVFPPRPIINLAPAGKRSLGVWYVPNVWDNATSTAVATLAGRTAKHFGELNLSTDLLTESNETIMQHLAYGAIMHLNEAMMEEDDRYYMGWITRLYTPKTNYISSKAQGTFNRFGIKLDEIFNNYSSRWIFDGVSKKMEDHIALYQVVDPKAFETHRLKQQPVVKTGKGALKKWMCPNCKVPIRASRNLHAVCVCGNQIEYVDKDRTNWYRTVAHTFEDKQNAPLTQIPTTLPAGGARTWKSTERCNKCDELLSAFRSWDAAVKPNFPHVRPGTPAGPFTVRTEF